MQPQSLSLSAVTCTLVVLGVSLPQGKADTLSDAIEAMLAHDAEVAAANLDP